MEDKTLMWDCKGERPAGAAPVVCALKVSPLGYTYAVPLAGAASVVDGAQPPAGKPELLSKPRVFKGLPEPKEYCLTCNDGHVNFYSVADL